jgi:hypothetical protein
MSDYAFNRKTMILEVPFCKQENISPFSLVNFSKCAGHRHGDVYTAVRTGVSIEVSRYEGGVIEYKHIKPLRKGYFIEVLEYNHGAWAIRKRHPDGSVLIQEIFDPKDNTYYSEVATRPKELNKRKYLDHWLQEMRELKEGDDTPVIKEWYMVSNSPKQKTLGFLRIDINSRIYKCNHFSSCNKEQAIAQLSQMKKEDMPEWKFGYIQTTLKTLQDFDEEAFVADMKAG